MTKDYLIVWVYHSLRGTIIGSNIASSVFTFESTQTGKECFLEASKLLNPKQDDDVKCIITNMQLL